MGGFGGEPSASSAYEDDNAEHYDDDDFEEQESIKKPRIIAGQVYPLNVIDDVLKPVVIVTKLDPAADGGGENEEDGEGEYSDDNFEGAKKSLSASKDSATTWSDTLQGKSEDRVSSAAPVGNSVDDDDYDNDNDEVSVASGPAAPAREEQGGSLESKNDVVKTEVNLVSIHAHRDDPVILPPPAPSSADPASQHAVIDVALTLKQIRLSEKRAAIATKRVVEYRETQAQNQAQQAAEAAAIKRKREQSRASNRKVYEQIGVSKLTGEQRYQLLIEKKKLLKQHHAAREKLEKHQRWYNASALDRSSNQKCLAPTHVAELQARSKETSRQRYRDTVGRAQTIKTQQAELHKQAKVVVAKCTHTEYVRGSYLLKQTPKKQPQTKTKSQSKALTNPNDTTNLLKHRQRQHQ